MAFTLIGGTLGGTVLTLVFLPALYALWYRITPDGQGSPNVPAPVVHAPSGSLAQAAT
jgi:hypothetical protein